MINPELMVSSGAITLGAVELIKRFVPIGIFPKGTTGQRSIALPLIVVAIAKFAGWSVLAAIGWPELLLSVFLGSVGAGVVHDKAIKSIDPLLGKIPGQVKGSK